ncbi:MAG TPA: S53 family peptidase [Kofleriaceae bacterium]|jgi:MYXO-CTERM domain-containing protein|nr:S53 family peptidase [Kofleriaceae bacterium]
MGIALGLLDGAALADSAPGPADGDASAAVCHRGPVRCLAHVRTHASGQIQSDAATPTGYGPSELQDAYRIDPSVTVTDHPTVAVVGAYGYAALESDLAAYRAHYGLPACTTASGCLRVVNQGGQSAPLPPDPPASDDWTVEAALDLDMVSAACPACSLLVVEANNSDVANLYAAEDEAAALGPTVITNSWGAPEGSDLASAEAHFDHPGIAIFVAAGDFGYNDQFSSTGTGPDYPGTSAHVIAVGATRLVRDATARGWGETAWSVTGGRDRSAGGSACSTHIAKPAYQTDSPCAFKATTDIAAVGDPATGVAVYNAGSAGWITVGGTSAAAPLVAAIFAETGNGAQSSGAFLAAHASALNDVVTGNNGTCSDSKLCNAGVGWDGPTGYGTPNATELIGLSSADAMASDGGGCSTGGTGAGAGALIGLALLGLRRRPRG